MKYLKCFVLVLPALCFSACKVDQNTDSPTAAAQFRALLDEHWVQGRKPKRYIFETTPMPGAWTDRCRSTRRPPASAATRTTRSVLARLRRHSTRRSWTRKTGVSYRVFRYERETEQRSHEFPDHYFPFTRLFGYHTYFAEAPANMSFLNTLRTTKSTSSAWPIFNALQQRAHYANMREAIEAGYTHYCDSIDGYDETIALHVVDSAVRTARFSCRSKTFRPSSTRRTAKDLVAEGSEPDHERGSARLPDLAGLLSTMNTSRRAARMWASPAFPGARAITTSI